MEPAQIKSEREHLLDVTRSWLGTPYRNCARLKGAGVDCAMLVVAAFEDAGLESPINVLRYSPQWYLNRSDEKFLSYVMARAVEITERETLPGDIVVYKFGRCYAHGGIIIEPGWPKIIHAFRQAGCVVIGEGDQGALKERQRRFFRRAAWAEPRNG